jgi:hypothetical protein
MDFRNSFADTSSVSGKAIKAIVTTSWIIPMIRALIVLISVSNSQNL